MLGIDPNEITWKPSPASQEGGSCTETNKLQVGIKEAAFPMIHDHETTRLLGREVGGWVEGMGLVVAKHRDQEAEKKDN